MQIDVLNSTVVCLMGGGLVGGALGWVMRGLSASAQALRDEALLQQTRQSLTTLQEQSQVERHNGEAARLEAATLKATLETERRSTAEKLAALGALEQKMKDAFGALAADALNANAKQLLEQSRSVLEAQKRLANKDLEDKELSIANLLRPMKESLQQLTVHSQQLEVQREGAYKAMLAEVANIQRSHTDLRRETTQLVQALRAPKVRGNWGEMQLRRCVEYAGMVEHASFEVEKFVRGEDVSVRPDMVVRLPNQRCIVIDAKTPLEAFLNAAACEDELARTALMNEHAAAVRKHLDSLASKAYWNRFKESPDFVVCFLPSEVLFSAALEHDAGLLEYSANSNVILATPTTLIALLKAVAFGWQQAQTARDADLIREYATSLYKKFAGMHDSLLSVGAALGRAGVAYDDVINKAEGRGGLFSIARKLRELKIGDKDLAESKPVAVMQRALQHEDWQPGLALAASEGGEPEAEEY